MFQKSSIKNTNINVIKKVAMLAATFLFFASSSFLLLAEKDASVHHFLFIFQDAYSKVKAFVICSLRVAW